MASSSSARPPRQSPLNQLSTVELVSHGEHLGQAADDLDRASTPTPA